MAELKDAAAKLIDHLKIAIDKVSISEVEKVMESLAEAHTKGKKVLVVGVGRSGLVGRAFAMRLMHLGFIVHVVGETITPALVKDDILFAISGSGSTTFVVDAAKIAKRIGARIISITSHPESPLGKLSDLIVTIPGRVRAMEERRNYFSRQILGDHEPLVPLGTLFEVSTAIFLDSLIVAIMKRLGKTEAEMRARHATIE